MHRLLVRCRGPLMFLVLCGVGGCGSAARIYPVDSKVARSSVEKAMQAWVDGKSPKQLQPEIIVGDTAWENGVKLLSFEILTNEDISDGSNLHLHVKRKFGGARGTSESTVKYIVSTSPVITIFPQ